MYIGIVPTSIGLLEIIIDDHFLFRISFPASENSSTVCKQNPVICLPSDDHLLLCRVKAQLNEYFQGNRQKFDLPLHLEGTVFQQAVWKCMLDIPYGETRTYGEVAEALGNRNKARAVGGAANKNPLPMVIPCHRVVGSSGSLTGFAGGAEVKKFLLDLESRKGFNKQCDLLKIKKNSKQ
ncbi:MAG: methylated-DNA--[protein]-cysteine S-methyltransferase [Candidatus Electrothrix sp. ATG2]|nr:methylated-DNA--[protein]-cysteine S-methyltransferase [Candidatus Electrothrix sp. ATG2]